MEIKDTLRNILNNAYFSSSFNSARDTFESMRLWIENLCSSGKIDEEIRMYLIDWNEYYLRRKI